jgi:hypothetical protein
MLWSWDSSAITVIGMDRWGTGVQFQVEAEVFLFSSASRPALGPTQPPIQLVLGVLFPGAKLLGHEADHLLPSSAKVIKMNGAILPLLFHCMFPNILQVPTGHTVSFLIVCIRTSMYVRRVGKFPSYCTALSLKQSSL